MYLYLVKIVRYDKRISYHAFQACNAHLLFYSFSGIFFACLYHLAASFFGQRLSMSMCFHFFRFYYSIDFLCTKGRGSKYLTLLLLYILYILYIYTIYTSIYAICPYTSYLPLKPPRPAHIAEPFQIGLCLHGIGSQ